MTIAEQAGPVTDAGPAVIELAPPGVQHRRPWVWIIGCGLALLASAATISAATVDSDSGTDLVGLARTTAHDIGRLRWQYTAIVVALAALHYLATAVAARSAAGVPLRLGETLLVQLAAAAANRLTPAGLGARPSPRATSLDAGSTHPPRSAR